MPDRGFKADADADADANLVQYGDMPLAINSVNGDIRRVVDVSSSASALAMFRRAMAYQPVSDLDSMRAEVDRVFSPEDAISIQEINADLMRTIDKDPGRVEGEGGHTMIVRYVSEFVKQFDRNLKRPSVQGVLDTVLAMCEEGIMQQMGSLFWRGSNTCLATVRSCPTRRRGSAARCMRRARRVRDPLAPSAPCYFSTRRMYST